MQLPRRELHHNKESSVNSLRFARKTLHNSLIDSFEDDELLTISDDRKLRERLSSLAQEHSALSSLDESTKDVVINAVIEELHGMGPISPLMLDPSVTDILINGPFEIWVERSGQLVRSPHEFDNEAHLQRFLDRIVSAQGRQLNARNPMVDAKLADGSRLHAIIPPLCSLGAIVSIRRFQNDSLTGETLVRQGFLSEPMLAFLQLAVKAGVNIMISGSAGAGKTSLLNVISQFVPQNERIVTVEETAELRLKHPHVIPLESRPENNEGNGGIGLGELVRNALRMRANRIIVGEVRGCEVLDMLQAMNCGHSGSLTTLHANSPKDVVCRLETLAQMGGTQLGRETIRQMILSSVQLIVQVMRFRDGTRRIISISELERGVNENTFTVNELFHFNTVGQEDEHKISGKHAFSGHPSNTLQLLEFRGFKTDKLKRLMKGAVL